MSPMKRILNERLACLAFAAPFPSPQVYTVLRSQETDGQ